MATSTLYIGGMVFFNNLRYNGEGESGFHLMPLSMVRRLDPLLNALLYNSYGIVNLLMNFDLHRPSMKFCWHLPYNTHLHIYRSDQFSDQWKFGKKKERTNYTCKTAYSECVRSTDFACKTAC